VTPHSKDRKSYPHENRIQFRVGVSSEELMRVSRHNSSERMDDKTEDYHVEGKR
jgi:hypothetical protein